MDRDKIIKGLECCTTNDINACDNCPYCHKDLDHNCVGMLQDDILAMLKEDCHNCKLECLLQKYDELKEKYDALLKEQEATMVIESENMYTGLPITHCPKCGVTLDRFLYGRQHEGQINYCPMCGQAIKWE